MASQPLNSTIQVFRRLRGERNGLRHESIKALTAGLRPLILQIPGAEVPAVEAKTRDANKGVTTYDEKGRPLVVGYRATTDFHVYANFSGVNFPVRIGQDKFIENTPVGLGVAAQADLFGVAKTNQADTSA